jgi:hypothetical protein
MEVCAMEDLWRLRGAVLDRDELADQATYQRLLKGFRAEEEEAHRRRLLFGDDRIDPVREQPSRDG